MRQAYLDRLRNRLDQLTLGEAERDALLEELAFLEKKAQRSHQRTEMILRERTAVSQMLDQLSKELTEKYQEAQAKSQALEQALQQLQAQNKRLTEAEATANAANRAKSQFLATMSHEIRTPMNGIIGMAEILSGSPLSEEQAENLDIIRHSSESLLTILNDILDFSKIESGKMDLEARSFSLRRCIEDVLDLLGNKARAKHLDLCYEIAEAVPPFILGDQIRLRQILTNLLSNAIKFTPSGQVLVAVSLAASADASGKKFTLCFSVHDSGIGIPATKLSRLFQPFQQVDASTTREYGGTGLGLAISRRLVELMGGTIWAESEAGKGSVFSFTIQSEPGEGEVPGLASPVDLGGKMVWVVDDNAINRRILRQMLNRYGLGGRDFAEPEALLAAIASEGPPDLLVLDYQMPSQNGLQLAEALREGGIDVPTLMLSSDQELDTQAALQWVDRFALKPIRQAHLWNHLQALLGSAPLSLQPKQYRPLVPEVPLGHRHPLRLLVAEDNLVNQKIAVKMFAKMGYAITLVPDGREAVNALKAGFDLVFMDMQMPVMDGFQATRKILERYGAGAPPIIAMTANAMSGDREACLAAGMQDYLSKPIKFQALQEVLTRWIRRMPAAQ